MSTHGSFEVWCDGQKNACQAMVQSYVSIAAARKQARLDGWLIGLSGNPDLCPKCKPESSGGAERG